MNLLAAASPGFELGSTPARRGRANVISQLDLPVPAIRFLREVREAILRAASPLERALWKKARALPPLWLRRHAGPVGAFVPSALEAERLLVALGLVGADSTVLDLGCGPGAMIPSFERLLAENGRYVGADVHAPSIAWCRERTRGDARFRFEVVERESPYRTSRGSKRSLLPLERASVDLVIAKSLFTHVLAAETAALLSEIRRVLRPGGRALVTAFLFEGQNLPGGPPFFRHPEAHAAVRWHQRRWPHAAVAYERSLFEFLAGANGLVPTAFVAGFFPGAAAPPRGQDILVLAPEGEGEQRGAA